MQVPSVWLKCLILIGLAGCDSNPGAPTAPPAPVESLEDGGGPPVVTAKTTGKKQPAFKLTTNPSKPEL